jgi:hypothetical protein
MLKGSARFALLAGIGLFVGGCAAAQQPLVGALYSDLKWDGPISASPSQSKEGRACGTSILGIVAQGDASITAAKAAGGISEVSEVDHATKNILFFWAEYCTIVRGR